MNLSTITGRLRKLSMLSMLSMLSFLELAAFYSIIVIISQVILMQPSLYIAGIMWFGGMSGIAISLLVGLTRRWLSWLCILLTGGFTFLIAGLFTTQITAWIMWLVVMITSVRGHKLSNQDWKSSFPLKYQLIGIGCTLVLSMFASKLSLTGWETGILYMAGVISLCSWLLRLNSEQVEKETLRNNLQRGRLRGFAKVNRRWSIMMLVVMLIVGSFTQWSQGFYWLWIQFANWLNRILSNTSETQGDINPPSDSMTNPFLMDGEVVKETKPSIWMDIMYWIVGVLVSLVVMYAFYKLLQLVYRKLGELVAKLGARDRLSHNQPVDNIPYMDQVEKIETKRRSRPFRRKKNPLPDDLRGRVRYYYQSMIRRAIEQGLTYSNSQTPNEVAIKIEGQKTLGVISSTSAVQEMTSLYNDVRYGDKIIEEHQLQHTVDRWKNSK
jgi:hypothetical protein